MFSDVRIPGLQNAELDFSEGAALKEAGRRGANKKEHTLKFPSEIISRIFPQECSPKFFEIFP